MWGAVAGYCQKLYSACDVARRWMHHRLWLCDLPDADTTHAFFLSAIGSQRPGAIKAALALDEIDFGVEAKTHGRFMLRLQFLTHVSKICGVGLRPFGD